MAADFRQLLLLIWGLEMATRSTVTLHPSQHRPIHLYRHWDGGPWGTGSSLAKLLRKRFCATNRYGDTERIAMRFAEELIRLNDHAGGKMFELTSHAEHHGDTEWHYDIFFTADGELPAVRVKQRKWGDSHTGDRWEYAMGGDVKMFRRFLAEWLVGMLQRMREVRRSLKPSAR